MRDAYVTSLCWHGLIGGMLYVREDCIQYRTNKLIDPKLRDLRMPLSEIESAEACGGVLPFVSIRMNNGKTHKFLVFARKRFLQRVCSILN